MINIRRSSKSVKRRGDDRSGDEEEVKRKVINLGVNEGRGEEEVMMCL